MPADTPRRRSATPKPRNATTEPDAMVETPAPQSAPEPPPGPQAPPGPQLARAVLDAARVRRAERTDGTRAAKRSGEGRRLRGYSGSGPDPRDPQLFGAVLERLLKSRGWQKPAAEARIFGMWPQIVGEDLASHCRPVKLEEGVLTIEAESTAWATQIKLLAGKLLGQIGRETGRDVVKSLNVHGPVAPSWSKGPKRVRGRGPRDTYG